MIHRMVLNYKQLPYRTEWLEYPDIEGFCRSHDIPPTGTRADGSGYYSLPAIHDPKTGIYVADSIKIAEYLEETYPETPAVFPDNSLGLQRAFTGALGRGPLAALWQFIMPLTPAILNPPSAEYFRRTKKDSVGGKDWEVAIPQGEERVVEWNKLKEGLGLIANWYKVGQPFIMGETASWGDFAWGGYLWWVRELFGAESQDWKDLDASSEGRWSTLLDALSAYQQVV